MGGRGASSGVSKYGNKYGTQYHSLLTSGEIKFVTKNSRGSESLMETMTDGRVYAVIGGDDVRSIMFFDDDGKKTKQIDLTHPHDGMVPHVHHGYEHQEYDPDGKRMRLTEDEWRMVDRVLSVWKNRDSSR